jgi:hypothetical protein
MKILISILMMTMSMLAFAQSTGDVVVDDAFKLLQTNVDEVISKDDSGTDFYFNKEKKILCNCKDPLHVAKDSPCITDSDGGACIVGAKSGVTETVCTAQNSEGYSILLKSAGVAIGEDGSLIQDK